jgi:hypothetical protein
MFWRSRLRYAVRSASLFRMNLRPLPRCVTWCGTSTAMTRAKRVTMRPRCTPHNLVEPWTKGFAETPISLIPVCPHPPKLSLKSGLAEVNIKHLHSGHAGAFNRNDEAERGAKRMIRHSSGAQEVIRHRFIGYVLSVTTFRPDGGQQLRCTRSSHRRLGLCRLVPTRLYGGNAAIWVFSAEVGDPCHSNLRYGHEPMQLLRV